MAVHLARGAVIVDRRGSLRTKERNHRNVAASVAAAGSDARVQAEFQISARHTVVLVLGIPEGRIISLKPRLVVHLAALIAAPDSAADQ